MTVRLLVGDCRDVMASLPERHFHCVVTSPPYFQLRSYLPDEHPLKQQELGIERRPEEYVEKIVEAFRGVRRVLRDDGVAWLNLGDSYAAGGRAGGGSFAAERRSWRHHANRPGGFRSPPQGLKPKDLVGIPWMVAFALRADGWWLRGDIIWAKSNPTPESVKDRPTRSHEHVFLLSKSETYHYDEDAIREPHVDPRPTKGGRTKMHGQAALRPRGNLESAERWYHPTGRNRRDVWTLATEPYGGPHFAVMPRELVKPCILAGTSERGCCSACGAPWTRKVLRERLLDGKPAPLPAACSASKKAPSRAQGIGHNRITIRSTTTGWRPSCSCGIDVAPCRVLDPFGGTGTVGMVAEQLGRDSTLIDIDERSIALAEQRTSQGGLFASGGRS